MSRQQDTTTYLTQKWYDKLVKELHELKETKLPNTLEKLKEAIEQWDISENAEYDTAMSEKELFEKRINEIEHILTDVSIIERQEWWQIRYGSEVTIQDDKKRTYDYTIVWSGEIEVNNKESSLETISFESPLWRSLRGKEEGDIITVKAPNRKYTITITKVK